MRALARLDQGDHRRAIKEAVEAYALLDQPERKSNNFYRAQLIEIAGIPGIGYTNLNRDREVERCLSLLEKVDPTHTNLGRKNTSPLPG